MHLRRTDKIRLGEAREVGREKYMEKVEEFFKKYFPNNPIKKKVFVSKI